MPIQSELLEPRTLLAATITPLVTFTGANGMTPGTVIQDNSGDLIGITNDGGANGFGEIFRLPNVDNPQLQILYSFTGGAADGGNPISLAMNAAGDIFGTTEVGGVTNDGIVFKVARGSSTIEKILDLDETQPGFGQPATAFARLAPFTDPAGNLYGLLIPGTVFRIDAGTSNLTRFDFVQGTVNDLTIDSAGNLFGTTFIGGATSSGSIFTIPAGSTTATTVAEFTEALGVGPNGLVVDSAGNLYGSTVGGGANGMGGIFRVAAGTSNIELLGSFEGTNGNQPAGKPALDDHGHLFGITRQGGANDSGTFYKLPAGSSTILPVVSLGLNETTIPVFTSSSFGDIQQPIVSDVNASLDPDGWHLNYPPPPPAAPEPPTADVPADDQIRVGLPIGGPPVGATSAEGFGELAPAAETFGGLGTIVEIQPEIIFISELFRVTLTVPSNFPTSAVAGGPARLRVKVDIQNDGDTAVVREAATVKLFLSVDGQVGGATELATATLTLSLKPDQSKVVPVRITSFPSLTQGSYQLVAQVTDSSNHTAAGAGPSINLAPPFVSSAISNFAPTKPTAVAGKRATFALTLTNNGNVNAAGSAAVTSASLTTDPSGAGGQSVTVTKPLRVKLKPAAQRTLRISFTLPQELPAGAYVLSLTLDVAAIGDTTPANGVAVTVTPLTVS